MSDPIGAGGIGRGADVDQAVGPLIAEIEAAGTTIRKARLLAWLAEIYLDVGDHFEAGRRAWEATATLENLGFADPATAGPDPAFEAWLNNDYDEDLGAVAGARAFAMLSMVTAVWSKVIRLRTGLCGPAESPGAHLVDHSALQQRLISWMADLEAVTEQVHAELSRQASAFGVAPTVMDPAQQEEVDAARETLIARQSELVAQAVLFNELFVEFDRHHGVGLPENLLTRIEALESEAMTSNLPGTASMVTMVSVLRSDALVHLSAPPDQPVDFAGLDEAVAVLGAAKARLISHPGLTEADRRSLLVTVLTREVLAQTLRGDFNEVSRLCGEGIAEVEHDRGKVNGPYLQDSYLRYRGRLYTAGVFAAFKCDDHESMLARMELAKARGVLGWVTARPSPADHDVTDGRSVEQEFAEVTAALASGGVSESAAADSTQLLTRRRVLWDQLMTARARSGRTAQIPEFSIGAVQASLTPDEAVISYYWLAPTTLLIVTLDSSSPPIAEKVDLRKDYPGLAAMITDIVGLRREEKSLWFDREIPRLGKLLLPKTGRHLLAGKTRLILTPHRLLQQLPFAALDDGGGPLIERFALSYVPNLTSLLLPARTPVPAEVLVLGVSHFAAMRALENAAAEATEIAALYERLGIPTTSLIDAQVTRERIEELRRQGTLSRFTTLHLATHGDDISPESPFDAALHLPVGTVDAMEISQWKLRADLVVLSACHSARRAITGRRPSEESTDHPVGPPEELFGDEVYGLQAAFFAAGAQQLLGTLWPVSDRTAPMVMAELHRRLAENTPADVALQQAMLALRATNRRMFHWAAYKLVRVGTHLTRP